jgi:hypothetical protein
MGQIPPGYPPPGYMPPPPPQYILPPSFPPIQSYPGDYFINSSPAYKYGPSFDGSFQHGTVTNPYLNYLFEDTNAFENTLYQANGPQFGYPPLPVGQPMPGMMPPPGGMPPMHG